MIEVEIRGEEEEVEDEGKVVAKLLTREGSAVGSYRSHLLATKISSHCLHLGSR